MSGTDTGFVVLHRGQLGAKQSRELLATGPARRDDSLILIMLSGSHDLSLAVIGRIMIGIYVERKVPSPASRMSGCRAMTH